MGIQKHLKGGSREWQCYCIRLRAGGLGNIGLVTVMLRGLVGRDLEKGPQRQREG